MYGISVKQEHINLGDRCSPRSCPITQAIQDKFPGRRASVGTTCFYIFNPSETEYFVIDNGSLRRANDEENVAMKLPEEAAEFVFNYDHRLQVEPFSF